MYRYTIQKEQMKIKDSPKVKKAGLRRTNIRNHTTNTK